MLIEAPLLQPCGYKEGAYPGFLKREYELSVVQLKLREGS